MVMQSPAAAGDDIAAVTHGARWHFGAYELNEKRGELRRDGELLKIETKPLNLLMLLVRHPGELITKNDLINALWPGGVASDAMLGGCVARLRTALGEEGASLIRNVFGHGYRFDGEPALIGQEVAKTPPRLELKADDAPPMRPNWRLVRRLGLSGDCWLAEHVKTRQKRVFKFSNEPDGLASLKREVTIYRLLRETLPDRPRYLELIDWNFEQAPWFIEAEYCVAGSLQEWFTAQGGVERVPLATRLDLVAQIAETVAAVHAVGVLHKDLKPANVFVVHDGPERQPTIRLADFGSSGFHDTSFLLRLEITRAGCTQLLDPNGKAAGTLRYLAPEVMAGQPATVRADVYAIGVILYQLVIGNLGRRPEPGWEQEIDDDVLREDIGAAANGDPELRLSTAGELARRLRAIEQRRLERIAARNAEIEAAAAHRRQDRAQARRVGLLLAAASLVLGMVFTVMFAIRANEARILAESEAARARAVGEFLAGGMFSNINEDVRKVRDMTVRELVDRAADRIPEQFSTDLAVKADLHAALGRAYDAIGVNDRADAQLRLADAAVVALFGLTSPKRLPIAARRVVLSFDAERLRADMPVFEAIAGAARQDDAAARHEWRLLQLELLRAESLLGRHDRAVARGRTLLASSDPLDPAFVVGVQRLMGVALHQLGEVAEAHRLLTAAFDGTTRLHGPDSRRLIGVLTNLAMAEMDLGLLDAAQGRLDRASALVAEWLHGGTGWDVLVKGGHARLRYLRGGTADAVADMEALVRSTAESGNGAKDGFDVVSMYLVELYLYERRFAEAEVLAEQVRTRVEKTLATEATLLAQIRMDRATALAGLGRVLEARQLIADIESGFAGVIPRNSPFFDRLDVAIAMMRPGSHSIGEHADDIGRRIAKHYSSGHPLGKLVSANGVVAVGVRRQD